MKLGLKIWSINKNYLNEVKRLIEQNIVDYIELYSVPDSFGDTISLWSDLKKMYSVPFIVHAPHFMSGLNFAVKEMEMGNLHLAVEAFQFADELDSSYVIFHPGCNGSEDETIRQINLLNDSRMLIENKPKVGIDGKTQCNGYNPSLIYKIIDNTGCGFCMDFSHAICAANSLEIDPMEFLGEFSVLNPVMYHFCDGDWKSEIDSHTNIGKGDYPLEQLISLIPQNSLVSIETKKHPNHLQDFDNDAEMMRKLIQ